MGRQPRVKRFCRILQKRLLRSTPAPPPPAVFGGRLNLGRTLHRLLWNKNASHPHARGILFAFGEFSKSICLSPSHARYIGKTLCQNSDKAKLVSTRSIIVSEF